MIVRCFSPIKTVSALRLLRLLVLLQIGQGITVWGQQINSGKTEACEFLNDAWPTLLANHQVLYPTADKIISFLSIRQQLKYWANFNSRKYTGLDEKCSLQRNCQHSPPIFISVYFETGGSTSFASLYLVH